MKKRQHLYRRRAVFALCILLVCALLSPAFAADVLKVEVSYSDMTAMFFGGSPSAVIQQPDGSYLILDQFNKVVWYASAEETRILAGRIGPADASGEPMGGYNDADFENAAFALPWDITPFLNGYLVSDSANHVVRFFSADGLVLTAVGSGSSAYTNDVGIRAEFNYPTGLATDAAGDVYIADTGNNLIRKIDQKGSVTLVSGQMGGGFADGAARDALFDGPTGLTWHEGRLYIADTGNHRIRCYDPSSGMVTTVAGVGYPNDEVERFGGDYADGAVGTARFSSPMDVSFAVDGAMYVSDSGNAAIRRVYQGQVTTLLKGESSKGDTFPLEPRGLLTSGSSWLVCDVFSGVVFSPFPAFQDEIAGWAQAAVSYSRATGLLLGNEDGYFMPASSLQRGDASSLLQRMDRLLHPAAADAAPAVASLFGDVDGGDYFFDAIHWAAEKGYLTGTGDGNFGARSGMTRQDFVVMLYRYARENGKDMSAAAQLGGFMDAGKISDYALPAVSWAVEAGLLNGNENKELNPLALISRAEAAVLLYNYQQLK